MRFSHAIFAMLAAAGLSAPAAAQSNVYVPIGFSDQMIVLVQVQADPGRVFKTTRASQFVYYAPPSFSFEDVPIRLTKTDFEIDCENPATRRLLSSAYRDIDDRVGSETYSEPWAPIAAGDLMGEMHRLACKGIGPADVIFSNLDTAVRGFGGLLSEPSAE